MQQRSFLVVVSIGVLLLAGVVFVIGRKIIFSKKSLTTVEYLDLQKILNEAKIFEEKSDLLKARDSYKKIIEQFPDNAQVANWQKKVEDLNIKLLFSNQIIPGSQSYEVQAADSLVKIAKKFKTTIDLIKKSNGLSDNRIYVGQKLKVLTLPFNILVDKSQNILLLKQSDDVFKAYRVSTGANNSTPVGTFKIKDKIINPVWYKPGASQPILPEDPENILGTRWMGFDTAPRYGIHGTKDPASIGTQVTQGCVRMLNSEVEELFTIIPEGTEVNIID